jgi:3',5'-cyclic AMP phosphodiesterase CpdA
MNKIPQVLAVLIATLCVISCSQQGETPKAEEFSFAFMTDIHVQYENRADEGYRAAVTEANALKPDFVITGGDLIMDALGVSYDRADSQYVLYQEISREFKMPVYNTLGNHEMFGIYKRSGVEPDHPEYSYGMYEKRLGETYYSFDYEGWHFMILKSVIETEERQYIGMIDEAQMEWIRQDLLDVADTTPIVISTHIPFITVFTQVLYGEYAPEYHGLVVENARDVLDLFEGHTLRLVLQGHLHYLEDIEVNGTHFITGGAVSGRWWSGPNHGVEEGFLMVHVKGDEFCWEYVDYGWIVE